jgi:hypothetical protein
VFRLSSFYRVDPVQTDPAALGSALACLDKRDGVDRAQAHFARLGIEHEAVDPRLGPAGAHLEIKPAAIVVHALPVDGPHLDRGEPI